MTILLLALLYLPTAVYGMDELWRWYYITAHLYSENPKTELLTRAGTARVVIGAEKIHIDLFEPGFPEDKAEYVGRVTDNVYMTGMLNRFFYDGPQQWDGAYRLEKRTGCIFEEISLMSAVPDGSRIVLVRKNGCK